MAKKPETKFKEKIVPYLKTLPNTWFYKTQEVCRRGIPDFAMCIRGHSILLELKIPPNECDALQVYEMDRHRKAGGLSLEVTPENWSAVFRLLMELATGRRVLTQEPQDDDERPEVMNH